MTRWIPTGSVLLDKVLEGGFPSGMISLVYGEAETGKSTLAMQSALSCATMGFKTLYVDSDGTFSPERLLQLGAYNYREALDLIMIVRPSSFDEQAEIIDSLDRYINERFALLVFDTITSLYRQEVANTGESFHVNRELNRQVATIEQIAKIFDLAVILVSQVRGLFGERVMPVATRVLKFWSDNVLSLNKTGRSNVIRAVVEKKNGAETDITFLLAIEENGIRDHIS
ncbi:MAG: AAA family ATPase [Nitrososphaerota archaeon]|nr:AAA family ATPase [Candidatus Bathyarchaeota archaeon]MDW8048643.1 AAA family ATPase [Nitrososphaerota archaeon]